MIYHVENSYELYEKLLELNLVLIGDESLTRITFKQQGVNAYIFFDQKERYMRVGNALFKTFIDPVDLFFLLQRIPPFGKWSFSHIYKNSILFEYQTDAAMLRLLE